MEERRFKLIIKEVIIYKDYIEVIFNVVFSFVDDEITQDIHITIDRDRIKQEVILSKVLVDISI